MLLVVVKGTKTSNWVIPIMQRIPVVDSNHQPLMPTTSARARKWIEAGIAIKRWSDCGQFYVQLTQEPSGRSTQEIVIGVDPGKNYPSFVTIEGAKIREKG